MIEKITLENALENFTQSDSMGYVVGLGSGKGCIVQQSKFARKDDKHIQLSAKALIRIAQVILWERFAVLCLIGSSDGSNNSLLRITGTLRNNNDVIISPVIDGSSNAVKLLYKLTNGVLSVYLYSTLNEGSCNPLAIISSHPIVNEGSTTDISGYTELSL